MTPGKIPASSLLPALMLSATILLGQPGSVAGRTVHEGRCVPDQIARYTAYRASGPVQVDGQLSEDAWATAPRSPRFVDMTSGEPGLYDTQAAAVWDDENLYVAFWVEEPFVTATLTERDSLIFNDSDVEVFLDGGDAYYEFEMNALNTIYEVFFIWKDAYRQGGIFDVPQFDLFHPQTVTFGGNYDRSATDFWRGTHPRGNRWAFPHWDFPGLRSAVHIDGRINDLNGIDKGWTAEIAFPWKGMKWLANGRQLPPKEGDVWRIMFARFEQLRIAGRARGANPAWVWSPHGEPDTHRPECFPFVRFSAQQAP